jgi:hypothetical protein
VTRAGKPASSPQTLFWQGVSSVWHKLELGDAVVLFYIAAFVRQYLWIVHNNSVAWFLTFTLSTLIWILHLRTKERSEKTPFQFWLVVALPLFAIYATRAAFPDTSFDTLDYRLINGERALRSFPFIAGDFFPIRFPFNPVSDMVTGIFRHLLGYRLGTIVNYLVGLSLGMILNCFLRPYIKSAWLRSFGVVLLLLTEHVLFIINNYMVDLLALPLLMESTRLALSAQSRDEQRGEPIRIGLMLGASVAFKLTNMAFALPILILYSYKLIRYKSGRAAIRKFVTLGIAFLAPLAPYTLFIYWQTGNPVFPLYNKIFRSPFWPTTDFAGKRWGPIVDDPSFAHMKWWEVLLWPILLPFKIEHTAGDLGRHAGRISLAFIACLIGLFVGRNDRAIRALGFVGITGAVLWSTISGMHRYGIYLELIGGVILLYLISQRDLVKTTLAVQRSMSLIVVSILVAQSIVSCVYVYRFEWGSRPSVFENFKAYARDSRYFLRDYSLPSFLPERERALIAPVQAWAESSALESGVEVQINPNVPAICLYMPEYFSTDESRGRFAQALRDLGDKRMFALPRNENFEHSIKTIRNAGLTVGQITPLAVPYFSDHTRIHMVLIEVLRAEDIRARTIRVTEANTSLVDLGLRAGLTWSGPVPSSIRAGLKETVYVRVKNQSNFVWPARGRIDGAYQLAVGNHWLNNENTIVINDDGRSLLLFDLNPGDEMELPLTITAPKNPGDYVLEIDMVQEGVAWLGAKGSETLRARIKVY